jgi:hypothetical protein
MQGGLNTVMKQPAETFRLEPLIIYLRFMIGFGFANDQISTEIADCLEKVS